MSDFEGLKSGWETSKIRNIDPSCHLYDVMCSQPNLSFPAGLRVPPLVFKAGHRKRHLLIKYIGFINRNELFTLYKNCLALSYVSYGGPENLPPLEAFSVGCPVIATKNAGSIEQLRDGAILIDPNNSDEFVESILKLQNEKYKEDLIEKGKKISEKKSVDNFMIELKSLILSLKKYIDTWKNV